MDISKLKVPELKKELELRGFTKTTGILKAGLVEKLTELIEIEKLKAENETNTTTTKQQEDITPKIQNIINDTPLPPPPPPPSTDNDIPPPPPPQLSKFEDDKMDIEIKNKIENEKEKVSEIFKNNKVIQNEKVKEQQVNKLLNNNNNHNNEQIIVKPKEDIIVAPTKRKIEQQHDGHEEDDDFDIATFKSKSNKSKSARKDCPYLDTVDRKILDFDFEKICSVSFHNHNVYACLVCGKYFQGKSQDSHANYHCLQTDHHVFINLKTQEIYCLPDDYRVEDSSLDDIKYLLNPTFTREQISQLDKNNKYSRSLDETKYLPGIVGLNNIKNTAYVNVIIQSFARIPMIRDYLLYIDNVKDNKSPLVNSLSELLRKIWNPKNFKSQVSPHELLQAIQNASQKRFNIRESSDPLEFLQWFLNSLHKDLGGTKQPNSSIIYKTFSGEIQIETDKPIIKTLDDIESSGDEADKDDSQEKKPKIKYSNSITKQSFLFLSLDLPPKPVFKDDQDKSIIPQIPLFNLLSKYDGSTTTTLANGEIKRYKILSLPKYLIFCVKRFSKNNFFVEKEPTIVNFPIKNLDLNDYLPEGSPKSKFNLLATIKHEGDPNSGNYAVYVNHKGSDKWFEMQDLSIKETMPQLIAVSECYFLIYEKVN